MQSSLGTSNLTAIRAVAIQSDSRIVLSGETTTAALVLRLLPSGRADRGFGTGGAAEISFNGGNFYEGGVEAIAFQSDGKLILGGVSQTNAGQRMSLYRLENANLDPHVSIVSPAEGRSLVRREVTIRGLASDDTGISRIEVRVNGGAPILAGMDAPSFPGASIEWNAPIILANGLNRVEAQAFDADGRRSAPAIRELRLTPGPLGLAGTYTAQIVPNPDAFPPTTFQGEVSVTVSPSGAFSGRVKIIDVHFPDYFIRFRGTFLADGTAQFGAPGENTILLARRRPSELIYGHLSLILNASPPRELSGRITDLQGAIEFAGIAAGSQ